MAVHAAETCTIDHLSHDRRSTCLLYPQARIIREEDVAQRFVESHSLIRLLGSISFDVYGRPSTLMLQANEPHTTGRYPCVHPRSGLAYSLMRYHEIRGAIRGDRIKRRRPRLDAVLASRLGYLRCRTRREGPSCPRSACYRVHPRSYDKTSGRKTTKQKWHYSIALTKEIDGVHRAGFGQVRDVLPPVVRVPPKPVDQHHWGAVASLRAW